MVASAATSSDTNSLPQAQINSTQVETARRNDSADVGHSVDAEEFNECDKTNSMGSDEGDAVLQETPKSLSGSDAIDTSAGKLKDVSNKETAFQAPFSDEKQLQTNYSIQLESEKITSNPMHDTEVTRSKSMFLPSELSTDDRKVNPNIYWLNTEFDRLVSDKRKSVKTTNDMRKEMKEIGLGDTLSYSKPKSLEDIMREYGLEPTISSTHSYTPLSGVKSAWTSRHKFGITNVSQNNETSLGLKSEMDEVKTHGSSVDGEYSYLLNRRSSNANFVNTATSRENTSAYAENKPFSRTNSFSYYDFKTTPSATNLDSLSNSKPSLEMKRMDDRSTLNPSSYFQRERERLQRIDAVISRTPKNSYTSISHTNAWDYTTDHLLNNLKKNQRRQSYANLDQDFRMSNYDEEKDWGNTSPSRAFLQRSSTIASPFKQHYAPMKSFSNLQSHDNPVYRDSSTSFPTYAQRHYSRSTPTPRKEQTTPASKSTKRTQPIPTKDLTKTSDRSTYKSASKVTPKSKQRTGQSSSAVTSGNKNKSSLADVDKEDFVARLMKNYSNSCIGLPEKEPYLRGSKSDAMEELQDFIGTLSSYDQPTVRPTISEPNDLIRNEVKIKSGKYKPYQPNVTSQECLNSVDNNDNMKSPHSRVSTAWGNSFDMKNYLYDDDNNYLNNSAFEYLSQNGSSKSRSRQMSNFDSLNGAKTGTKGKMKKVNLRISNNQDQSEEDTCLTEHPLYTMNDIKSTRCKPDEKKTKNLKRSKSVCLPAKKKLGNRK